MKNLFALLVFVGCVAGCAETAQPFVDHPEQYGLFVASTNLYFDIPLVVEREGTNETIAIPVKRYAGNYTGYLVQALPPGRYYIHSYSRYSNVTIPLHTSDGFFDVQANCFNYGGYYNFQLEHPPVGYQNTTALEDIERLPAPIRKLAVNRNVCLSSMGDASQRLSSDDLKDLKF